MAPVRLRSEARKRPPAGAVDATVFSMEQFSVPVDVAMSQNIPTSSFTTPLLQLSRGTTPLPLAEPQQQMQLLAVMGNDPPFNIQDSVVTPPTTPSSCMHTWEETTPVKGKPSGLFVLHMGSTPQPSPMSRDLPNRVVNQRQLQESIQAKICRRRKGQTLVRRRSDDLPVQASSSRSLHSQEAGLQRPRSSVGQGSRLMQKRQDAVVASPGWEPPQIQYLLRSPISTRSKISLATTGIAPSGAGSTSAERLLFHVQANIASGQHLEGQLSHSSGNSLDASQFFIPGCSPPRLLLPDPVHSPTEHSFLRENTFSKNQRVQVQPQTLDLDPELTGNGHGISGVVVARFYHHVTGTPTFQVDFGGVLGTRSVQVADTAACNAGRFGQTRRSLFIEKTDNVQDLSAEDLLLLAEDVSDEDPEWTPAYEDFHPEEANMGSGSDAEQEPYNEDPLQELGLYDSNEDLTSWPVEKVFGDDQWQDSSIALQQNTQNFSGPPPGPTSAISQRAIDYFLRFWPPESLHRIVNETNRYAMQPSHKNPAVTNGRDGWQPLDVEELLAWFGILILMGLKEFPHLRCYWDRRVFYNCPVILEAMSRDRFEAIVRCVHLVNNNVVVDDERHPAYDKIEKVRWLCDSFTAVSQSLYNNERILTVDEIMVPYKGRFCSIRQYMKSKPVKFGVKVWALANSTSRYVSNIIVYLGANSARSEGDSVGEDAVLTTVAGLEGRGHVVITDNFFTSPHLFMELMQRGFWATGTCRKTRKGFPTSLAGFSGTDLPERGHLVVKMHRNRSIAAICWMDAKPMFLLSTACDPIGQDSFAGR